MTGGVEWLIDAFECDARRLRDEQRLRSLADALIERLRLNVLGTPQIHAFDGPGGVTGLYLLSESHFAWHTYPESRLATFNLYCCREREPVDWRKLLGEALGATRVSVRRFERGAAAEAREPRERADAPARPAGNLPPS